MDDCTQLRQSIRSQLQSGRMPLAAGYQVYETQGNGASCACCHRAIPGNDVRYEVDCPTVEGPIELAMHPDCYELWLTESKKLGG